MSRFFARIVFLFSCMLFTLGLLVFRLFSLAQNSSVLAAAQNANSYRVVLDKSRGCIYDRELSPLVCAEKVYKVAVLPSLQSKAYLHRALPAAEFSKIEGRFSAGKPFVFETDRFISESQDVKVFLVRKRYAQTPLAVHLIGYCDGELAHGVAGIEKAYDPVLGAQGASLSLRYPIDAAGRALSGSEPTVLKEGDNTAGVVLTLSQKIQTIAQSAARLLPGKGSILVCDVQNGDILAGVSLPEYKRDNIAASIASGDGALLNRNLCAYNIGSTFKIAVCAAALSRGISPSFSNTCNGAMAVDGLLFHCHKQTGHGFQTMQTAFANSCNPYFIKLGLSVGKERLLSTAAALGLGSPIELCDNMTVPSGNLPAVDELTGKSDLANVSFGQGSLLATPVHIAKMISIVANGGLLVEPRLVRGILSQDKTLIETEKPVENVRVLSAQVAAQLRSFMIYTVENGTGRSAKPCALGAGGKTASAETGWSQNGQTMVQAWFSGFYPAEKPQYAIVVLCEGGNSGAASCAPAFREICNGLYKGGFCS